MSNFLTEEDEMDVLLERGQEVKPKKAHNHKKKESFCDFKLISFVIIGGLTLAYVVIELGVAVWLKSLALLSDGFHNLSDVISLYIAFWAVRASKREASDAMSYGWVRAELIGGLINGCFLLSLSLYVLLESIPRFIQPESLNSGWWFISVAAGGLIVNTVGTIIFAFAGISHGHSHSHGGHGGHGHGGHGHGGHGDKKKDKKHGHGHGDKKKHKDNHVQLEEHDDDHDHDGHDDHGHGHGHGDKKNDHGHGHGDKKKDHGHGHGHGKKDKEHLLDHGHDENGHETDLEIGIVHVHKEKKEKKEKHGHGHGHGHGDKNEDDHGHGHGHGEGKRRRSKKKESKWKIDLNVWAVFIHYLGDMISSLLILITGLILKYVEGKWTDYIDPAASVLIVALILWTTIPLVKKCSIILLQSTPEEMEMDLLREDILAIAGVESVHELHVWGLTDGMIVSSAHMQVEEGVEWRSIVKRVREVLHEHGIHSSCIQPEFVPKNKPLKAYCEENCVKNCEEDWCCKKKAEKLREDPFSL